MIIESALHCERIHSRRKPLGLYVLVVMSLIATGIKASSPLDGYTPSLLTPGSPAGTYPLSGFETVNLYNGNLNFSLHLGQVIGRGAAQWPIFFNLETTHWMVETYAQPYNCTPTQICYNYFYYPNESAWTGTKGPSDLYGRQIAAAYDPNCLAGNDTARTRLTFRSPDGTEFELVDPLTGGVEQTVFYAGCYPYSQQPFNRGRIFVTADGSAATFISDQDVTDYYVGTRVIYPSGYLLMLDGTRYRISDGWIVWIRDRNGNQLTFTRNANTPNRIVSVKDSIGRQVTYTYSSETGLGYDEITFTGFGGLPKTIRIYIGGSHDENIVLRRDYRSSQGGTGFRTYQQLGTP